MTQDQQNNRKDLKIQALKERVATIVAEYEDRDSDRRVEITELNYQIEYLQAKIEELSGANVQEETEYDTSSE